MDALQGHRVIDVACGSGDAQTLCLTDDDMVWSWGDGDYGKLGRGGSDGCKIPMKVKAISLWSHIRSINQSQFLSCYFRSNRLKTTHAFSFFRSLRSIIYSVTIIMFQICYFECLESPDESCVLNILREE